MQKTSDYPKEKRVGSFLGNLDVTATAVSNDPFSSSGDVACQSSYTSNGSRYSSPIASPYPYEVSHMTTSDPVSVEHTSPGSLWVSPDLILDSSKV